MLPPATTGSADGRLGLLPDLIRLPDRAADSRLPRPKRWTRARRLREGSRTGRPSPLFAVDPRALRSTAVSSSRVRITRRPSRISRSARRRRPTSSAIASPAPRPGRGRQSPLRHARGRSRPCAGHGRADRIASRSTAGTRRCLKSGPGRRRGFRGLGAWRRGRHLDRQPCDVVDGRRDHPHRPRLRCQHDGDGIRLIPGAKLFDKAGRPEGA